MPMIKTTVTVPAGESVNLVENSIYEFLPWPASIVGGVTAEATGIELTVNSGSDTILEESPADILSTFARIPDEMNIQDVAAAGERMVFKARNTTVGDIVVRTLINLTPL